MEEKKYYKLTNPQKTILLTEQYYKNTCVNNIVVKIHFKEIMNIDTLKHALEIMVEQNDVLRTRIIRKDNEYFQYFEENVKAKIEIIKAENEDEAKRIIRKLAKKNITLLNNNLIYYYIIKYNNGLVDAIAIAHHIISDAWTVSLYAKETIRIYQELENKKNIEQINYSYTKYINEEQEYFNSEKIKNDMDYWNSEYKEEPNTQFFKNDNSSIRGDRQHFIISEQEASIIKQYCKKIKISEQCLFMSVLAIYLSKISNSDNITIGMPILNRRNFSNKRTMGMFIETLPFYINVNSNMKTIEFLKYITEKQYLLLKHHRYPYELLQKDIKNKFGTNQKMYSVAFSYQNAKIENSNQIQCETSWEFNGYCPDDLQVHINDLQDMNIYNIYYDYKINSIKKDEIEKIHKRIINLINQIIKDDNKNIKDLEIITAQEKKKIEIEFNNTNMPYCKEKTIAEIISEITRKFKKNIAVCDLNGNITYEELENRANILANYMLNKGVKNNDVVGILLAGKNIELIIAMLAILKIGASFILLYNGLPKERMKFILKDSNAKVIITDSVNFNKYNDLLNINVGQVEGENTNINVEVKPSNVAYLIYTSGTTGRPKGIELTNNNLINFIYSFNEKFNNSINETDRFLSITNVSFDVSIAEMFTPLFFGATLYLYKDLNKSTIDELVEYINYNKITFSYFPPTILEDVVDKMKKYQHTVQLNKILVGVEPIKSITLEKFIDLNKNIKIINGYGPSETTICSTMYCYNNRRDNEEIVPIGSPIGNTKIYILNKDKNIVPIDNVGEIYICGEGVGKGYKNNEILTEQKYINYYGTRAFKTGDLAKWNQNGDIIFLGRNDNQIKFRGYRIDLGEIENTLKTSNKIKNAVVILDKEHYRDEKLLAFVVLKDEDIVEEVLRELLSKTLPYYMMPSKFIKLKEFPMTANGKVDKKKLIEIASKNRKDENIISPQNEIQKRIYNVLNKYLNNKSLSINDNFFDMGIDSLQAISLIVELEKENIEIALQDFYNYPSIKMLADKIDNEVSQKKDDKNIYLNKINYKREKTLKIDGNVLLLGATGFLGSHILKELIDDTNIKIYCLVRATSKIKAQERLIERLDFYFESEFYNKNHDRIIVVNGDFTENNFGMNDKDYIKTKNDISMIINSAACVKHFGKEEYFYNINYLGVKKALEFCSNENKQFVQISTISILKDAQTNDVLDETTLYDNQKLDNIYIKTKFEAEQEIAEAINKGVNATIFRLGNIMWRDDGKFQINDNENSFVIKLKTIMKYKVVPKEILNYMIDLSPVDLCAKAIVLILSDNQYTMYHIENNNKISIKDLIGILKELNISVEVVDKDEFKNKIINLSDSNEELVALLENYENNVRINSDKTIKLLKIHNFNWNNIDKDYIKKYIL